MKLASWNIYIIGRLLIVVLWNMFVKMLLFLVARCWRISFKMHVDEWRLRFWDYSLNLWVVQATLFIFWAIELPGKCFDIFWQLMRWVFFCYSLLFFCLLFLICLSLEPFCPFCLYLQSNTQAMTSVTGCLWVWQIRYWFNKGCY